MAKKYWLMKCEPDAYTIDDLARDKTTSWEGVRNYQARNFMRDDMQVGDGVLFYASNADPSGVTGLADIVQDGYPDHTAWTKGHHYFDKASTRWVPCITSTASSNDRPSRVMSSSRSTAVGPSRFAVADGRQRPPTANP